GKRAVPYDWPFILFNNADFRDEKFFNNLVTEDRHSLEEFMKENTMDANASPLIKLKEWHERINKDFDFYYDNKFITGEKVDNLHFADYIRQKKLRQLSSFKIYRSLLKYTNEDYYYAFAHDRRIESWSPE